MSSKVHQRGPAQAEMNITPLIDVVFLLIIFFMLVSNIISEETVQMVVPKLVDPQTYQLDDEAITVSVPLNADWVGNERDESPLNIPGKAGVVRLGAIQDFPDLQKLQGLTDALKREKAAKPNASVILRADSAVFYSDVQKVYEAVSAAGIETIHMVALTEDEP